MRLNWLDRCRFFITRHLFHSTLAGSTAGVWWRALRENGFDIDSPYWLRTATVSCLTLNNSLVSRWETYRYGQGVAAATIEPPIFILGHWRSGTTHLHNLLALDRQFAFPNSFQVLSPATFLTTERFAWLWSAFIPRKRGIDQVRYGFREPQEDEFAICALCLKSSYLAWSFPRRHEHYLRYLTLRDVPEEEVAEWKAALVHFLRKLSWKSGRPLLLKSPPHTCRIRRLLELFPDARFVHIHRHPYAVFVSTKGMIETVMPTAQLQRRDSSSLEERVLRTYRSLHEAFFEERSLIPAGHYHELAYDDLERDPIGEVERIYTALGLDGFKNLEPSLRSYLASIAGYEKNRHPELADPFRERIAEECRSSFAAWGYSS